MNPEVILGRSEVTPKSRVTIYRKDSTGTWIPTIATTCSEYRLSEDRKFGASTCDFTFANPRGLYSYDRKDSPVNYIDTHEEVLEVFSGVSDFNRGTYTRAKYSEDGVILDKSGSDYHKGGEWVSPVMDSGAPNSWKSLSVSASTPSRLLTRGTSVSVYVREGDSSSTSDGSWTPWRRVLVRTFWLLFSSSNVHMGIQKRYLQVKIDMESHHGTLTPKIKRLYLGRILPGTSNVFSPLLYWRNRIKLEEGLYDKATGSTEWYTRFYGIVSSINPQITPQGSNIQVEAYDMIKMLLDDVYEKPKYSADNKEDGPFEPKKNGLTKIRLERATTDVENDEIGHVYRVPEEFMENVTITNIDDKGNLKTKGDQRYVPWAQFPAPIIKTTKSGKTEVATDGYEIDHARGEVYFVAKKEASERVDAEFYWYNLDSNRFEEVVADIIMDAYEKEGHKEKWTLVNKNGNEATLEELYSPNYEHREESSPKLRWVSSPGGFRITLDMSYPRATIPRTFIDINDKKTHYDVIQELMRYVDPSYRIYADSEGNFIGGYQPQKSKEDAIVRLKTSITTPVSDANIYTKVVAFGRRRSNVNIGRDVINIDVNRFAKYRNPGGSGRNSFDNEWALVNGSVRSNVGYAEKGKNLDLPNQAFEFELTTPIYLGRVDVLFGHSDTGTALPSIEAKIQVSPDGESWIDLGKGGSVISGASNQWASYEKSGFEEGVSTLRVKCLRIIAIKGSSYRAIIRDYDFWSIKEVQIWPDDTIRAEVDLYDIVDEEGSRPRDGFITRAFADRVMDRLGTRTLVLPMNEALATDEEVRARAKDFLYDTCRTLNTATVDVIYSPHIKVGMTVKLEDETLGLSRLYYVESVTLSRVGDTPSASLELTSWD